MSRYLGLLLILLAAVPALAQQPKTEDDKHFRGYETPIPIGDFLLQERDGQYVRTRDLLGKIWVAQFFYPGCNLCSRNTPTMQRMQERYRGKSDIRLVSVDLLGVKLETLQSFAKDHQADDRQWLFLTGTEAETKAVAQGCFSQFVFRNEKPTVGDEISHETNLVLVDWNGNMVGRINGVEASAADELQREIDKLRVRRRMEERIPVTGAQLPWFNAMLNSSCTVLLILGWVLIKMRYETLHKIVMLLALAVSMIFLSSYLFYHFVVLEMESMRFQGEGPIRYVYFTILLSHTILAILVAPLAITITVQGLRDARLIHRKMAKWTLPIWLYVSVTGVIVYWMLYRMEW